MTFGKVANALVPAKPTLEAELALLVAQFGADAVREAAKNATKKKRGRPAEKDWPLLKPWIEKDVADWLAGKDPFGLRSNYFIAREFASAHPGHSQFATKDRIERKLSAKRKWMVFARAHAETRTNYPFELHLRAAQGLVAEDPQHGWSMILEGALGTVALFRERFSEPDPKLSFEALQERLRRPPGVLAGYAATGTVKDALLSALRQ